MNITEQIIKLADQLDNDDKIVCADLIDNNLVKTASLEKVSQYVGVIGYFLQQTRAMQNCLRKKRVAQSGPMQTVVMDCLKEYQDSNNYQFDQMSDWTAKYAKLLDIDSRNFKTAHLAIIAEAFDKNDIAEHYDNLIKTAELLKENGESIELLDQVIDGYKTLTAIAKEEIKDGKLSIQL